MMLLQPENHGTGDMECLIDLATVKGDAYEEKRMQTFARLQEHQTDTD